VYNLFEVIDMTDMTKFWPIYEFRVPESMYRGKMLRYAAGDWSEDDGEYDVAFIGKGREHGSPMAWYVDLHHHQNILWSWDGGNWARHEPRHPGNNAWHYMLREGETDWDGNNSWKRRNHPNSAVGDLAMSKRSSMSGCANGRGLRFEIGDPFITAGLVREFETKKVVAFPEKFICMYCGELPEYEVIK